MPSDQEFLLYPLDTGEDPARLGCGAVMVVAAHEVNGIARVEGSGTDAIENPSLGKLHYGGRRLASLSRNTRCMRSTTVARASLAIFLSALPNFTPKIAQLGSRCVFGVSCRTITPTKSSQPGAAFLMSSEIANSSSEIVIGTRRSLCHQFFFGGSAPACWLSPVSPGFEVEEIALTAVTTFTGGFDMLFWMAKKINAFKYLAAMETALPRLSSFVASCKISKSRATQRLRIKIQANILVASVQTSVFLCFRTQRRSASEF
jgi:hypothetical protein